MTELCPFLYWHFSNFGPSLPCGDPENVSIEGLWWPNIECWIGIFVIIQGIQTSIAGGGGGGGGGWSGPPVPPLDPPILTLNAGVL